MASRAGKAYLGSTVPPLVAKGAIKVRWPIRGGAKAKLGIFSVNYALKPCICLRNNSAQLS